MDAIAVLLRFIHIGGAIAWLGSAFFLLAILDPMAARIGATEANRIMRHLVLRSKFNAFFPIVAVTTVVAGLLLYWRIDAHTLYPPTSSSGIVFHVGVLFGILSLIWGGAMEGRLLGKARKLALRIEASPNPGLEQEYTGLMHRLANADKVSGMLLVIGMFGMATFRYF
jgi:uncharacterized membrane protein